ICADAESAQPAPRRYRDLQDGPPAMPPPSAPRPGHDAAAPDPEPPAAAPAYPTEESAQEPPLPDADSPPETKDDSAEPAAGQIGQVFVGVESASERPSAAATLGAPPPASYEVVTEASRIAALLPELMQAHSLGLDTETTGLSPREGRVRLLQL